MNNIKCPTCGGASFQIGDLTSNQLFKCASCENEFYVRIHFIDTKIPLETKVFKALIDATDPKSIRKLQMKAKKAFAGTSNFYTADLDRQISQGETVWDLGFYSEEEVARIKLRAAELDFSVEFVPS